MLPAADLDTERLEGGSMEPGDGEADPLTAFQTPREEPPIMMAVAEDTSDEVDTWRAKNISVFATKNICPARCWA